MNKTKISTCIITYNQEEYISKCIEGCINQIVNYEYEILIGDDFSSDNTTNICKQFYNDHSKLIKFIPRNKNLGMIGNWISTISECTGKYIALCEGDDYWTDPYKLQKQVDFLEANPDYVACFHPIKILETDGTLKEDYITKVPLNYETIEDLAKEGNYIHTPSVVFRNVIKEFPEEMNTSPLGDFFLYMLLAEHGKIKCLPDTMAVYRNGVGIFSAQTQKIQLKNTRLTFFLLWKYFSHCNVKISHIFFSRMQFFDFNNQDVAFQLFEKTNQYILDQSVYYSFLNSMYNHEENLIKSHSKLAINNYLRQVNIVFLLKLIFYKLGLVKLRDKILNR